MENRDSYIALNLIPGVGPVRVNQLLSLFGEPSHVLSATPSELARVPGIGGRLADAISGWARHCDPDAERALAERAGVTIVTREDEGYPSLLREIYDPPLCLYVRGELEALSQPRTCIAIVGSRRTTAYGVRMAEHLATGAAVAGWTVVSGLAQGIDTAAHEAALHAGGRTVAILGSGLGRLYPQANVKLARRISESGALVSEFPMQFPPSRNSFPMRNRIISGMTVGTLVVEAGARSGSLITASQALEQGRQVFAVPGRADSPQSKGCHGLIKDGAKLVETFGDVLEEFTALPGMGVRAAPPETTGGTAGTAESAGADLQLSDVERKIMAFVHAEGETDIDGLVVGVDEPAAKVMGALVTLEMRRLIRQLPGRRVALRTDAVRG